ncbi:U4/U6-U5 snRNP complex subunit lsm6 [Serendipita sp. 396]|nr:U4/U6-U5 snRNP complex subunit lsm6 [Serendipita sp. 396]KAG8789200.1 U4/U6-U5 snRNP complex subunit lsm6 [Serendipita sp. 397]KAG8804341.1 U4/U6-U5 snRNP complex subunit lsm6 [Serendipita sp. 398]KAG8877798.1 U4/U6-U5 snRNP complex subunit lsm6 [Serendipita sp. 405]
MSDIDSPPADETLPSAPSAPSKGSPNDFLKAVVGKRIIVRLISGVDYKGVLQCLDGYMNIAMEQTEEHVNGVVTNRYGDAFIRGNNVLYISAGESI